MTTCAVGLQEFAADWIQLASIAKGLPNPVPLAVVDATEHKELADRLSIYGYPSIQAFHGGENEVCAVISFMGTRVVLERVPPLS